MIAGWPSADLPDSAAAMAGSSRRRATGSGGRGRAPTGGRAKTSLDYELAAQIVAAAEKQWARSVNGHNPIPLRVVLETHKAVLGARGEDPVRDDNMLYQFLIKLQAETRPEVRWRDKVAAARRAEVAKRRRARPSKAARRSALLADDRARSALEELNATPPVQLTRPRTELWTAWRSWEGFVQHRKQLRGSSTRESSTRESSTAARRTPQPAMSLERSLESELIQAAAEADASGAALAPPPSTATRRKPLSPAGQAAISASHLIRTESQTRLARRRENAEPLVGTVDTMMPMGTAPAEEQSPDHRTLRRYWQLWCDWRYELAKEDLAVTASGLATSTGTGIGSIGLMGGEDEEEGAAASSAAFATTSTTGRSPSTQGRPNDAYSNRNGASEAAAAVAAAKQAEAEAEAAAEWDHIAGSLRRCGSQMAPRIKATDSARFMVHKQRLRSVSASEAKRFQQVAAQQQRA